MLETTARPKRIAVPNNLGRSSGATRPIPNFARALTELSAARPRAILVLWAILIAVLGWRGAQLPSEVGYAAYFGPRDPYAVRPRAVES